MFKITPIQNIEMHEKYARACGTSLREGFFAYAMLDVDTGELMGFSQFEIGEAGYISDILLRTGYEDYEALFILAKATMNFIDTCGAHTCYADPTTTGEKLLAAIGFKKQSDGKFFADMTGMFDGSHCSHT